MDRRPSRWLQCRRSYCSSFFFFGFALFLPTWIILTPASPTGDSDHNSAVWSGHMVAGVVTFGDDPTNSVIALNRAWTVWNVGVGGDDTQTSIWRKPIALERLFYNSNSGYYCFFRLVLFFSSNESCRFSH